VYATMASDDAGEGTGDGVDAPERSTFLKPVARYEPDALRHLSGRSTTGC
jgi:hypothetical protein